MPEMYKNSNSKPIQG